MAARKRSRAQDPDADESNLASALFGSHYMANVEASAVIGASDQGQGSADFAVDTEGSTFPEAAEGDTLSPPTASQQAPGKSCNVMSPASDTINLCSLG